MLKTVKHGALLQCTCGSMIAPLVATTARTHVESALAATVNDHVPVKNIPSFGDCKMLGGPCAPVTSLPWTPGSGRNVVIENQLALLSTDKLTCTAGGIITVQDPTTARTFDQ